MAVSNRISQLYCRITWVYNKNPNLLSALKFYYSCVSCLATQSFFSLLPICILKLFKMCFHNQFGSHCKEKKVITYIAEKYNLHYQAFNIMIEIF